MVELLASMGRTMGFSFAAGINLYATVAILGLASRYGWVDLPPQFQAFDNNWIIGTAIVLYVIEFFADKIPWVDSMWDAVHTVIRPAVGAILGALLAGEADDLGEAAGAVLGGTTALASHAAKASLRLAVNASPEPVSNIVLSLSENAAVVGVLLVAIDHPWVAVAIAGALLVAAGTLAVVLIRTIQRGWDRLLGGRPAAEPRGGRGMRSPPRGN